MSRTVDAKGAISRTGFPALSFQRKRPISTLLILVREGRQAMEITDILARSQILVKELAEGLNLGNCTFEQVEERILKFLYELGQGLEQEIVQGLQEPTVENSLRVGERTAVYSGKRNLRFLNRFGGEVILPRRCYKFVMMGVGGHPWMKSWDLIDVWAIPR